jgi:hypothetical protein
MDNESPNARVRPESLLRANTMLRGLLPGEESISGQFKHPVSSAHSSNTSSVVFVAHAVNRLKQLGTDPVASTEAAPGIRPRRRSKVPDEAPTDLRKQEQPGSMRWLPAHLWARMLWLTDCWTSFRLLPLAMIQSRLPTEGPPSKNEWLSWYVLNRLSISLPYQKSCFSIRFNFLN